MEILIFNNKSDHSYNLRVDCEQELSLMCSHSRRADSFDQLRVLVDQPRLAQHVGSSVLQLESEEGGHPLIQCFSTGGPWTTFNGPQSSHFAKFYYQTV